jgi:very-short-patch-repair endonuclease
MTMTLTDTNRRTQTPPLQGRGKGWGLSADTIAELQRRAREMRNNPTEPEKRLWRNLSNSQLAGFKFRRQEVIGRSIVDFFCPAGALAVEVDGDTHADPEREARRDAYLQGLGCRVLHVTNPDVMRNMDGVLAVISEALRGAESPHPNPSPEGEGLKKRNAKSPSPSGEGSGVGTVGLNHSLEGSVG